MAAADSSSDVRTRILETAWRLIGDRKDASVTLLEIARGAGVSRQTVYVNFGSRAGLLMAMVEHRDAGSADLARMRSVTPDEGPEEVLETFVRSWYKYVQTIFPVAHALQTAAAGDEDARLAWESRMARLHRGLLALMQRLQSDGRLAQGWTPQSATDWCHHLVHMDSWQHLVVEMGWRPQDVVQRTLQTLRAVLLTPAGRRSTARSRPAAD
jgi:AcrR family transcriptional regulator